MEQMILPLVVLSSFIPGLIIFGLGEKRHGLRITLNLIGALVKIFLVGWLLWGVLNGQYFETRYSLLPGIDFVLRAGPLSLLFVTLSTVLWLVTTLYAIGYLEHSPHRSRFFGFFSLCVTATVGVALAGNLFTFIVFYEILTLSTYPLIVHKCTNEARSGANTYLKYTMISGAFLVLATVWIYSIAGTLEFTPRGFLSQFADSHRFELITIFWLLIFGFGVKAALFPFHGWLPKAMVAPAPVSALLHAVAVVKAGAFGIIRTVYDVFGVEFAESLGVTDFLIYLAAFTIIFGSVVALFQDDLKKRLAYSTISQVSYITLGVAIAGPIAAVGGVVHLVHQGLMKITLFFCAGNLAETLGVYKVSQMNGVGKRMPASMAAFTIGAFGMIGLPPIAGFVSKWYLGVGAINTGNNWIVYILALSSFLNACYFLPIVYRIWFKPQLKPWPKDHKASPFETSLWLLAPPIITAVLSITAGLMVTSAFSPLEWAELISTREFYSQ
jgi:multicomponent Na+:H+ antiporter subunit D